jgi:hypothetical protein
MQSAGGLAPPPDSFTFDERGRQEYYAAVRATAQMVEQQRGAAMMATMRRDAAEGVRAEPAGTSALSPAALQLLLL